MKCVICHQRTGKRLCPARNGYICTLCCGQEREVTIECPYECPHLEEAYRFQWHRLERPAEIAYKSHEVPERFVEEKQPLIATISVRLLQGAHEHPGIVDADLRAVIDALVRTYETRSSGLVYDTRPEGPFRGAIYEAVEKLTEEMRQAETQQKGFATLRDGDVLKALVFLGRVAQAHDNGRPRGKSFLAFLRRTFPEAVAGRQAPSLIVPGA